MQGDIDLGVFTAMWDTSYLTDGTYELILHVICEPSGLAFPPPGINEFFSAIVSGVGKTSNEKHLTDCHSLKHDKALLITLTLTLT